MSNGGAVKGHHFNGSSSPSLAAGNDGNYPSAGVVPPQHALLWDFQLLRNMDALDKAWMSVQRKSF